MTISKRQLTKWRKQALKELKELKELKKFEVRSASDELKITLNTQIIQMTQELLDQYLLKEE